MKCLCSLIKPASSLCNMRCAYCFYADVSARRDFSSRGIMSRETAERIINNIFKDLDDGDEITFAFQGGDQPWRGSPGSVILSKWLRSGDRGGSWGSAMPSKPTACSWTMNGARSLKNTAFSWAFPWTAGRAAFYALDEYLAGNLGKQTLHQIFDSERMRSFLHEKPMPPSLCAAYGYQRVWNGGCKRMRKVMYTGSGGGALRIPGLSGQVSGTAGTGGPDSLPVIH